MRTPFIIWSLWILAAVTGGKEDVFLWIECSAVAHTFLSDSSNATALANIFWDVVTISPLPCCRFGKTTLW